MSQRILIFGGSGFIGHHLSAHLVGKGVSVTSVDKRDPAHPVNGVEYVKADVRDLSSFKMPAGVTCIYNLAAVHTTPGHPTHEYYDANVSGAVEITALAKAHGINSLVFTSSISVYGPAEEQKTEASIPAPTSAYGWSKLLAERIHRQWLRDSETHKLVIVRPAVVFGPYEGGNFTRLAKMLKMGLFVFPGRTDTIKACIYVQDLVEALEAARAREERYILFNGAYPDRYTIKDIVETFRAHHFQKAKTFVFPKSLMTLAATMLMPASKAGLGIHPDRIKKLLYSTDIVPDWLETHGMAKRNRLTEVLSDWNKKTNGQFY